MVDAEEGKLKAEIDTIVQNIEDTMKKIEQVVPLKPDSSRPPDSDLPDSGSSETHEQQNPPSPQNPKIQP
jgi:hypothetical protein